jgi:CheY-like chemotaxis protein
VGISPENQEKIFDPFFTTKPPGQGTGLGLSTVHGIVKGHRGFIQVRSQPSLGSQFKVYLPAIPSYVEVHDEGPETEVLPGNGETILVVDDEEAVRESLRQLLETNNYRVITAVDGREGMVCFVQQRETIRAIVTDIMMPVMDGVELTRAVRRIAPVLPIIGMSGLPEKEGAASIPGAQTNGFLVKPFVSDQLLSLLRSSLHAVSAPHEPTKASVTP